MTFKHILLLITGIITITSCDEMPCDDNFIRSEVGNEIIGFYPSFREKRLPIDDIPFDYLTRIIYAFAEPKENGHLNTASLIHSDQLIRAAHRNNVEVYFSIGGGSGKSDYFASVATNKTKRRRFIRDIVEYSKKYCFDGVDIDWEQWTLDKNNKPSRIEQKGLVVLLHDLNKALDSIGKGLSMDVYASVWAGQNYLDEAVEFVDYVHIMAYDFSGKWSKPKPHSSVAQAFGWDKSEPPSGVHYWLNQRKWSKEKLILGIPFYGRDFNTENVRGKPYREILAEYPNADEVDEINKIYYNSPKTVRRKVQLTKQKKLGGVMIWEITQDAKGNDSLLKHIFKEMFESSMIG
jgi:GH18 family chitinase